MKMVHMRWRDVRGDSRLANRLLKRVRDFAQVKYNGYITEEVADYALDLLDVDKEGLDQTDRGILLAMIEIRRRPGRIGDACGIDRRRSGYD